MLAQLVDGERHVRMGNGNMLKSTHQVLVPRSIVEQIHIVRSQRMEIGKRIDNCITIFQYITI